MTKTVDTSVSHVWTYTAKKKNAEWVGNWAIDTAKLPDESVKALLEKGVTHYLGNEQSAKWSLEDERRAKDGRDRSESAKREFILAAMRTAYEAMYNGTMSVRATRQVGPDELTIEVRRIAADELTEALSKSFDSEGKPIRLPEGKQTLTVNGVKYTRDALIDARLVKHGERIREIAARNIGAETSVGDAGEIELADLIDA
jgi:hypothetical protein